MIKKNKKHVLIGACALAGVALTSVGFATWVVGVQKTNEDLKLNVEVDSVQSDTKFLSVALTAGTKLTIAERTEVDKTGTNKIVGTKKNGGDGIAVDANALKFSFESITINMSKSVAEGNYPTKLTLKLDNAKTENAINKVADSAVKFADKEVTGKRVKGDGYTYLSYEKTITLKFGEKGTAGVNMEKQTEDLTKPYFTFNLSSSLLEQEFTWGSLFGTAENTTPTAFYNSIPATDTSLDDLLAASAKAYGEIEAMHSVFSESEASLTISASIN